MSIFSIQEKSVDGWKPACHRSLMPSFKSKRQAMCTIRRYVAQHDRTRPSMFRILKMKV